MADGVSHAGTCLFARLQPAAQELIRSVLSGLQKPSSVANPWAAGDPGVAGGCHSAASPGQPASCLQAPWLAGRGRHFLLRRDLPDPGIKPGSPTLQPDSLPTEL